MQSVKVVQNMGLCTLWLSFLHISSGKYQMTGGSQLLSIFDRSIRGVVRARLKLKLDARLKSLDRDLALLKDFW